MSDGGKGSKQRPCSNKEEFEHNWDAIFGKKEPIKDEVLPEDEPKDTCLL